MADLVRAAKLRQTEEERRLIASTAADLDAHEAGTLDGHFGSHWLLPIIATDAYQNGDPAARDLVQRIGAALDPEEFTDEPRA